MDDEGAVKAPMTRLRRRLSVEADDVKSPVTTPTKKRGGRLAAKPQLDLIDENTTDDTPKRQTRKTKAKEIAETEVSEDKPVTPSRRSARIRSNTSLILETTQTTDSPRAKRAARRTSQVGSDNEAPLTPARQTRKTRKESSSSIDKSVETVVNKTPTSNQVADIIVEETESNDIPVTNTSFTNRKSPRTSKRNSKINEFTQESDKSNDVKSEELNISNNHEKSTVNDKLADGKSEDNKQENTSVSEKHNDSSNNSSNSLIINMDTKGRITRDLNKTTSILEQNNDFKSKRHRTMSWSASFIPQTCDENFFSDNEIVKKKKKNRLTLTNQEDNVNQNLNNEQKNISLNTSTKKRNSSQKDTSINRSEVITKNDEQTDNSEKVARNVFGKSPEKLTTQVYVVDSDAESIGQTKPNPLEADDQCVPVVNPEIEKNDDENLQTNCSYEPMDIDETIPQNVSFENFDSKDRSKETKRKSSINVSSNSNQVTASHIKSESQILDKIPNEDKSTLIISQLKEVSKSEIKNTSSTKENSKIFSKSLNSSDATKDTESDKKNVTSNYMTSTPVHQKSFKKLGMQIDTSIISPKSNKDKENLNNVNTSKKSNHDKGSPKKISNKNDSISSDESESEGELSKASNILDDEAEEASKSYESGESQDEEEKQYEKENEIVEKGETLETEDEVSDDSDYEKDSFIVSSDAEDDELLSGSGDDLSMSDNELKMTAKSKQKYNERKLKEQKKASREMFEARHNIKNSKQTSEKDESKKTKHQRLSSSMLESDEEDSKIKKKEKSNNRLRIDSSQDESVNNSEIISKKKKKSIRLSESVCEDNDHEDCNKTNKSQVEFDNEEKEITIKDDVQHENEDPLLTQIKLEPKTPQKLNMSVVKINDNIEEVEVPENISLLKPNESSDPLQTNETDDESDSTDEKIMDDYNSVLTDLNKKNKKIKSMDISLNLEQKTKKTKEPIFDELNLTKPKIGKQKIVKDKVEKTEKKNEIEQDDDTASDSIDMKLLFPEDSNDSEPHEEKEVDSEKTKPQSPLPDFIPLKKTEAKMNISINNESMSNVNANNSLNASKKSRKSSQTQIEESDTASENIQPLQFFIDKIGNESGHHENISPKHTNKKQKKKSICDESIISLDGIFSSGKKKNKKTYFGSNNDNEDEPITDVTIMNNESVTPKNKKERKSLSEVENEPSVISEPDANNLSHNEDMLNRSSSKKKKNKHMNNSQNESVEDNNIASESYNEVTPEPQSDKKKKKKDKKKLQTSVEETTDVVVISEEIKLSGKKKKDKKNNSLLSAGTDLIESGDVNSDDDAPLEVSFSSTKKLAEEQTQPEIDDNTNQKKSVKKSKKRKRKSSQNIKENEQEKERDNDQKSEELIHENKKRKISETENTSENIPEVKSESSKKKNKKRKEREDDTTNPAAKVFKGNSFDHVTVSRLPAHILSQLDDKPKKRNANKEKNPEVIATTNFMVEERKVRKSKPSNYLEESIYLNDSHEKKKSKGMLKKPKVLPFIPTASTSDAGFTTNFKINVLPQNIKFVAQANDVTNFKDQILEKNKLKKFHTFETYKRQRNRKVANYF